MKKRITTMAAAALTCCMASGQISHSLYYMESVPQSALLNPALQPRADIYVAIPATNIYFGESTNLQPLDFFQKKDGKWLTPLNDGFSYKDIYDHYDDRVALDFDVNVSVLNFGWRTKAGHYWSFGLNERIRADVSLPSDLFGIGDRGLPSGTLLDLSNLGVEAMAYTELTAGYSYVWDDDWTFGARLKLIAGSAAVHTENNTFDIKTGQDMWHVKTDVEVMASMPWKPNDCLRADGTVDFDTLEFSDLEDDDIVDGLIPSLKNPGFGIDLGATYQFTDEVKFSASVTDLGFISWGRDITSFKSKGEFDFEGIEYDYDNPEHKDDFENALEDALDTIEAKCHVTLGNKKFKTGLRPSIYVGAEYEPFYFLKLGFLSHTKFYPTHRANQDFNISATLNPYKFPGSATFGYTINTMGLSSASFGFSLRMGILQFYTALDYIPAKYNEYHTVDGDDIPVPHNISNINVSLGLNIVLGTKGYNDRPMIQSNSMIRE